MENLSETVHENLLIAGNSGHGRVIKDLAGRLGRYHTIKFLDDDGKFQQDGSALGRCQDAVLYKTEYDIIVGIGNSGIRKRLQEQYEAVGISIVSLIHPSAVLPGEAIQIGAGTVVMANAVLQVGTVLGKGVIINTASSVDHDCRIGNYVHIAVGAHLAGSVEVGDGTWIGAGAVVSNNVHICENVLVGAGAVVIKDIIESGTYVGVPAKRVN